jgi:membrane dipeptidase
MPALTIDSLPIFDGHNDALMKVVRDDRDFFTRQPDTQLDYPRAVEGGFAGGFFAIFVSTPDAPSLRDRLTKTDEGFFVELDPPVAQPYALAQTLTAAARLFRMEAESDGRFKVVRTVGDLEACLQQGVMAAILHLEGAEAIDTDLDVLEVLYRAGLRSIGPVWSRPNDFGHGVPFSYPSTADTGPGLTDAGKALVRRCNALGVLVDLAHMNEKGFFDVAAISDTPLVATHTAAAAICPSARNLSDRQLDAVGESGGVVGLTYFVGDVRPDGQWNTATPLAMLADHIAYIADRIGIDHVALGSDFDGAQMPDDLKDAAGLPKLIAALRERGFDDAALHKIAYQNWLRVLRETWHE